MKSPGFFLRAGSCTTALGQHWEALWRQHFAYAWQLSSVGLVRTPTAQSGPRVLSEANESVRAIRALEQQVNEEAARQRTWKATGRDIVMKETP